MLWAVDCIILIGLHLRSRLWPLKELAGANFLNWMLSGQGKFDFYNSFSTYFQYMPSLEGSNKIIFIEVDDPQAVADYTFSEDGTMVQVIITFVEPFLTKPIHGIKLLTIHAFIA